MNPIPRVPHFHESILFQSRQNPNATAAVFGAAHVSYGLFARHIDNVTRHLQQLALAAGTRVLVDVAHPYLHWLVVIGASRLGLVSASADVTSDRAALLAALGTNVIVADRDRQLPSDAMAVIAGQAWLDTVPAGTGAAVPAHVAPDAHARILFSSGTTGVPKKIALSHGVCDSRMKVQAFDVGSSSRFLSAVSLSTIGGFLYPIRTWAMGGTVVFRMGADQLHDTIVNARLSHVFMSPSQLAQLVDGLPRDFLPLNYLSVIVGGGAIPQELNRRARARLTPALFQIYGSTEAGTIAHCHAALSDGSPTAAGYVVPGIELDVIGADGQPVAPGTAGELRVRGPWCVPGYADDDQSDAFRDGWFYPGDIAVLGATGLLSIVGRTSELMNLGGHKIAPMRIEEALMPHPGVSDIAAFALAGAQGIDLPWVAVVVSGEFDRQALVTRLRDRYPELPPLNVATVPSIPRNTMGKVLRKDLRERIAALLAQQG